MPVNALLLLALLVFKLNIHSRPHKVRARGPILSCLPRVRSDAVHYRPEFPPREEAERVAYVDDGAAIARFYGAPLLRVLDECLQAAGVTEEKRDCQRRYGGRGLRWSLRLRRRGIAERPYMGLTSLRGGAFAQVMC